MLIYAKVNSAFSSFVRLKLALVIQLLVIRGCQQFVEQPLNTFGLRWDYSSAPSSS